LQDQPDAATPVLPHFSVSEAQQVYAMEKDPATDNVAHPIRH